MRECELEKYMSIPGIKEKRRQKSALEIEGSSVTLIPPAYLGEESKFAPGESTNPVGSSHPCLVAAPPTSNQAPITSKIGIGKTCTPIREQ